MPGAPEDLRAGGPADPWAWGRREAPRSAGLTLFSAYEGDARGPGTAQGGRGLANLSALAACPSFGLGLSYSALLPSHPGEPPRAPTPPHCLREQGRQALTPKTSAPRPELGPGRPELRGVGPLSPGHTDPRPQPSPWRAEGHPQGTRPALQRRSGPTMSPSSTCLGPVRMSEDPCPFRRAPACDACLGH